MSVVDLAAMYAANERRDAEWCAKWYGGDLGERPFPGVAWVTGGGAPVIETLIRAVRMSTWDGSIVSRLHSREWEMLPIHLPRDCRASRVIVRGDRRAVDLSDHLPQANREHHVYADDRIPMGRAILETPSGEPLAVVQL